MLEVLTNPNGFFREKANEPIEWKNPLIIMAVLMVVSAISAYTVTMKVMSSLPEEAAAFAGFGAIAGVIGGLIGVLIGWVLYSTVFYIISLLLNGEGDFKKLMAFTSYGFIPSIIGSIVSFYYTNEVFSNIDFSSVDPQMVQEIILSDPSMRIAGILGIIFTLWSANIWIFGVMHSRNLTLKNAAITVGIPILLQVLYSLFNLGLLGL
ncbi:Yip1 family protein [Methanolobus sp. WCC4]|uniref:Yip1 family protein n=1 Tax=Methanolobus sp. WCC4 TaxID=3125784 RepID=UPI0030F9CA19